MALPALLAALERDLTADLAELEEAGRREAAAILTDAQAQADRLEAELPARAAAEAAPEAARIRARSRAAADAELRQAAESAFTDLLAATAQALQRLRDHPEVYPGVLDGLLDEALAVLPATAVVRVDPRDAALAGAHLNRRGSRIELAPVLHTWGGVELLDRSGRLLRNTLEERLDGALPALRQLFASGLPATAPTSAPPQTPAWRP